MYRPTPSDPPGVWQAYVEAGGTKDERNTRVSQAPEHLRERIRSHCVTAFRHTGKLPANRGKF
jgi:hypothetical protein